MSNRHLTLQACESYLYDAEVGKKFAGRALSEIFVNSRDLLPEKPVIGVPLYQVERGKIIKKVSSSTHFDAEIKALPGDCDQYFILQAEIDPFEDKVQKTLYLIHIEADFLEWDKALIIRIEEGSDELVLDQISDKSDFMTERFFKRFFVNFPFFLLEHGVKAVYPILAKKTV